MLYQQNRLTFQSRPRQKVIYLSADAYGVLPPVSILDEKQAQYHFLCGYTSKLAETRRYHRAAAFLLCCLRSRFPYGTSYYLRKNLVKKMKEHNAKAYLVNTGWDRTGKRISLKETRAIIDAILDGSIDKAPTKHIPIMNLTVPVEYPMCLPISWIEKYLREGRTMGGKSHLLAGKYIKNFEKYCDNEDACALVASGAIALIVQDFVKVILLRVSISCSRLVVVFCKIVHDMAGKELHFL